MGCDNFPRVEQSLLKYQEQLAQVKGIGKATKAASLHLTVACLHISDENNEMDDIRKKLDRAIERFKDLILSHYGFMMTFGKLAFGDYGIVWLEVELRKELVTCLREYIEVEAVEFITELRFVPHLTIFRKGSLETEEKAQLVASSVHTRLGCISAEGMTLRERKKGSRN